ncbi:MAG: hypothetical protein R2762_31355 [Bryobacteraceae bacterium]
MGLEARCRAHYGKKVSEGKATLESDVLAFRGDFRVSISFADMKKVEAKGADLHVETTAGLLVLEIGPAAPQWEHKIVHAPNRIEKLGVKEGIRVTVYGAFDDAFLNELRAAGADLEAQPRKDSDIVLVSADNVGHLASVSRASQDVAGRGALWIVYPKGQRAITQSDVMASGKGAGMVDVKVASFSPTHTALKFVVPVHRRTK